MFPTRKSPLQTLTLTPATDAGFRRFMQLDQNTFSQVVWATIRLTLQISVANATSVINKGSAAACFDTIGILENGFERAVIDPRAANFYAQMRSQSSLSSVRLASPNIGTYNLVETVPLLLTNQNALNPGETAFREKNPVANTSFFAQLAANAGSKLVVQGGATLTVTNVTVTLMHEHNQNQKQLPWFQPLISQFTIPILATQARLRVPLMTDRSLSAVILSQEGTNGEVSDIIQAVGLLSDVRTYIGNALAPWEDLERWSEVRFGGAVLAPSALAPLTAGSYLGIDFMNHGQLSTIIDPNETNLRFELQVTPTVTGGGGSQIRVTTFELVRDLNVYNGPDGLPRRVCNPDLLPWSPAAMALAAARAAKAA